MSKKINDVWFEIGVNKLYIKLKIQICNAFSEILCEFYNIYIVSMQCLVLHPIITWICK